jgi:cytochrome c5
LIIPLKSCPFSAVIPFALSNEKGPGREPGALSAVEERFELSEGVTLTRFRGVLLRPLGHSTIVAYRNRSLLNTVTAIQRPGGATLGKATCPLCHSITTPAAPDTQHPCISAPRGAKLCSMGRDTPKTHAAHAIPHSFVYREMKKSAQARCSCTEAFTHCSCVTLAPEKMPMSSIQSR